MNVSDQLQSDISSNQEIEKVKRRMGDETKLAHFGEQDKTDVFGQEEEEDGGFLQFYPGANKEAATAADKNDGQ